MVTIGGHNRWFTDADASADASADTIGRSYHRSITSFDHTFERNLQGDKRRMDSKEELAGCIAHRILLEDEKSSHPCCLVHARIDDFEQAKTSLETGSEDCNNNHPAQVVEPLLCYIHQQPCGL